MNDDDDWTIKQTLHLLLTMLGVPTSLLKLLFSVIDSVVEVNKLVGASTVDLLLKTGSLIVNAPRHLFKFRESANSTFNSPWFINSLPEEYRAHRFDKRKAMLEAGEAEHIIQRELFQHWFMAVIWTPIVSKLQRLIPPNRISS